ncbi:MAG: potassium/proton antiporter [Deltaproteobacteria bacterium HGW-Deltaproteobacteria-15]|jgi:cell volume regulation protein A|nr:MAG: potassium/proton antiporter [Deltaproteobacteria bacterium HGW-Deltaproteobacteria-15]
MSINQVIIIAAIFLVLSVSLSKITEWLGVPALLLFLGIGMLAGSDGPGGLYFDNAWVSQILGTVALAYILFAGGLETDIDSVKTVLKPALVLSTLGVLITALITGTCVKYALGVSWLEGLLVGSIVSSTDAAAVFAVLRSKNVGLKEPLRPLLELESGSNDPMAVFLTIGIIELLKHPGQSTWLLIPLFFQQMVLGLVFGYTMSRLFIVIVNRINLDYEGLYPVLSLAWVLLTYGVTASLAGSGFLAVYIAGIMLGKLVYSHKKTFIRFHDGVAWLMQIVMFLTLGLLVFPAQLVPVIGYGLLISLLLIFVARPAAVLIGLSLSRFNLREKSLISWVGLRGSVPIVLATFPLLAGLDQDHFIFNLVFFIVITSVLLQGTTIPYFARLLGVDAPLVRKPRYPIDFEGSSKLNMQLEHLIVPFGSKAINKRILDLGFPKDSLITLIARDDKYITPRGDTTLEGGDVLLILVSRESLPMVHTILNPGSNLRGE